MAKTVRLLRPDGTVFTALMVLSLLLSSPWSAIAADVVPVSSISGAPRFQHWLLHIDAAGVVPHPSAIVSIASVPVAGASLSIDRSATVTGDLSYFFTPNVAVNVYAGIPTRGVIKGSGSLSGLGTLATSMSGIAILSLEYHTTNFGRFKPYAGAGPGYTVFLNTHDRALGNVTLPNRWGIGFSIGADYDLNARWTLNAYLKQILLTTTVTGTLGGAPAASKTTLNPTLFGAGVGYRF